MKSSRSKLKIHTFHKLILSVGWIGFIPFAPGTWGTALALPLIYFSYPLLSFTAILIFTLGLTIASGFYLQHLYAKFGLKDHGWIVLDEFVAVLLAAALAPSVNFLWLLALFLVFRVFDIIKIWPANYFDQKLKNGWGILLDDIAASTQSIGILWLIKLFSLYA